MSLADVLLALMALGVGCVLACGSSAVGRVILFASALLVSAMLFLPGSQLTSLVGRDTTLALERLAATTPWPLSDWMHLIIFAWLGVLLWLGRPDMRGWKGWVLILAMAIAAELAQALAPDREPRLDDILLNVGGGMTGLLVGIAIRAVASGARRNRSPERG